MYALTRHAEQVIAEKGFNTQDVLSAANRPAVSYENRRKAGQMRHIGHGLAVVVDPTTRKIITVYANVVETEQRPDQTDADAKAHFTNRAKQAQKRKARQERDRALTAQLKNRK